MYAHLLGESRQRKARTYSIKESNFETYPLTIVVYQKNVFRESVTSKTVWIPSCRHDCC